MIVPNDILEILKKYTQKITYDDYSGYGHVTQDLGKAIRESNYVDIANEIYTKVVEIYVENSELHAKVNTYEAILENSNFKMAVVRKAKE